MLTKQLLLLLSASTLNCYCRWQITKEETTQIFFNFCVKANNPIEQYLTAYVILSGLKALIMHSFCKELLFFHSWGNFSFSGHSLSTNFFHLLADPSMSRSRLRNSSMLPKACASHGENQSMSSFCLTVDKDNLFSHGKKLKVWQESLGWFSGSNPPIVMLTLGTPVLEMNST